ncbi:MAG: hypothetical protein Alpg2KO_27650 [Alphaproteobacteria bacterium]
MDQVIKQLDPVDMIMAVILLKMVARAAPHRMVLQGHIAGVLLRGCSIFARFLAGHAGQYKRRLMIAIVNFRHVP